MLAIPIVICIGLGMSFIAYIVLIYHCCKNKQMIWQNEGDECDFLIVS